MPEDSNQLLLLLALELGECEYAVMPKTGQGAQNRSPYPKTGETAIFLTNKPKNVKSSIRRFQGALMRYSRPIRSQVIAVFMSIIQHFLMILV